MDDTALGLAIASAAIWAPLVALVVCRVGRRIDARARQDAAMALAAPQRHAGRSAG